ncbi:recombination protein O N-terminal domain-containing protein [Candidatus Parcubacteria bacterium]|nr:recombination protein O N-terminal domain-containing protein [Candidatus Parcubacteria bacterium]
MSHHIYNTRAFVLGARAQRERDKVFILLTKDLGLVLAVATGIRRASSKLGGILLDYALVHVSLVKGRNTWRITTATLVEDVSNSLRADKECLKAVARVLALLLKLVRGEEKHKELFEEVERGIAFLLKDRDLECEGWEIVAVVRMLFHLGYLSAKDVSKEVLLDDLSEPLVREALKDKKKLIALINAGIRESGLS